MKKHLQQTIQIYKEYFTSTLTKLKTPEGIKTIKKSSIIAAGLILIFCVAYLTYTTWQNRQPAYFINELNTVIAQKDLRTLAKLFNTKSIIVEFVDTFHPVQAYFFRDTNNHREINKDVLIQSAQVLLIEVIKYKGESDTEGSPEEDQKKPAKKTPKSIPIPEYTPFALPEFIPINLAELLADNTFTLQAHDDDIAIISTNFAHPELGTIPIKMFMKRGWTSWKVTHFANTYPILKLIAKGIQSKKDKAVKDFYAINKIINAIMAQYFSPSHCIVLAAKDHFSMDITLMVSADITNKGKYGTKETAVTISILSDQGNFIGNIPGNFSRNLPSNSTITQSWRRSLKATQDYAPQLFLTPSLACIVTPKKIVLESGQSISSLSKSYLEGL